MIPLCLEGIIVLILNLPSGSPTINNGVQNCLCPLVSFPFKCMIGNECIMVGLFSCLSVSYGYFHKVYQEWLLSFFYAISQGHCFQIRVRREQVLLSIKSINYFLFGTVFNPFVYCFV